MRALVCGVTGQDGPYLAELLLDKGYEVWGTSRELSVAGCRNLDSLGITERLRLLQMNPVDMASVRAALEQSRPDELYWLGGQSSVGQSFEQPVATLTGIVMGTLNLLEALRQAHPHVRFYHASSGECFGDIGRMPADESMPFKPASPYAAAKAAAHALVQSYRDGYGLFACNGILFNHESPLRPTRFVTRKVVAAAARARRDGTRLALGRLDISRDWGWAPDYVRSMWQMLQHDTPEDFVIATGHSHPLLAFVALAYAYFDLDWEDFVRSDVSLFRPSDRPWSQGNPGRARCVLGWHTDHRMHDVVRLMCEAEMCLV